MNRSIAEDGVYLNKNFNISSLCRNPGILSSSSSHKQSRKIFLSGAPIKSYFWQPLRSYSCVYLKAVLGAQLE